MDLRMVKYLENRMANERYSEDEMEDRSSRRRNESNRRNQIGFSSEPKFEEYRNERRSHKEEYDFEEDDFEEPKNSTMFTQMGGSKGNISMEKFLEKMSKSFKKELCDVMRYCEMAKMAEEYELTSFAKGLKEMCYEEYTHAAFLRANLKYLGEDPEKSDPDVKKLWQKVSRKFEES